jgi:segregation and condensation protein B
MTQDNVTPEPAGTTVQPPLPKDATASPAVAEETAPVPGVPEAAADQAPGENRQGENRQGENRQDENRQDDPPPLDEVAAAQSRAQLLRLVEALLFAAPGLVEIKEIGRRLPDGAPVDELVQLLEERYAGRGVNVVRVAGKIGLRTAPDLAGALAIEVPVVRKLSRAAIETLAIVAYQHADKKAVTRAEIEEIRGVSISKGTLDQLMEAGWIKPHGYREHVPGRPAEWVTTDEFLVHFGLDTLAQLPGVEELRAAGLLDRRPGVSQYGEQGALELPPEMGEQAEAEEGPVVDDDAPRPSDDTRSPA